MVRPLRGAIRLAVVHSNPDPLMKLQFLAAAALLAVVACVSTNATVLDPTLRLAETCPDAVKLYTTPARVPSAYREVALLNSKGESNWSNEEQMMESMRKKAAELGANGIILDNIDEPSALSKVIGHVAKTGTQRKGKALAIYVPADSSMAANVCATRKG
jgi:hypothetical protein